MKVIFILTLFVAGLFISFALGLRTRIGACNVQYQGSLDTITAQSQTVLSDWHSACTRSYGVITDWDMCLAKADIATPKQLLPWLRPSVSVFMMLLHEKNSDIGVLKQEHDGKCRDYTELMFYPPENE